MGGLGVPGADFPRGRGVRGADFARGRGAGGAGMGPCAPQPALGAPASNLKAVGMTRTLGRPHRDHDSDPRPAVSSTPESARAAHRPSRTGLAGCRAQPRSTVAEAFLYLWGPKPTLATFGAQDPLRQP